MAFTGNINNLFRSNLQVYLAPHTATGAVALPPHTSTLYNGNWAVGGLGWVSVGYTKDAVKLTYEEEIFDFVVEESISPVAQAYKSKSATLETTLAEFSLTNLQRALGGTITTLAGTSPAPNLRAVQQLCVSTTDCQKTKYSIGLEGIDCRNPGCLIRLYIPSATITLSGELMFSKREDDYTGIPIKATALDWNGTLLCWQKEVCP